MIGTKVISMKKIITVIALAAALCFTAKAQYSVGAGYLNQVTKTNVSNSSSSSSADGLYVGVDAAYNLGAGFSVAPGLYYSYLGSKSGSDLLKGKTDAHYLSIPVNAMFSFPIADVFRVFAFAGHQFNIGLSSKTTLDAAGLVQTTVDNYGEDALLKRFDLGINLGLGFDVAELVRIKFAYQFGLLDIDTLDNSKTNCNYLSVGAAFLF